MIFLFCSFLLPAFSQQKDSLTTSADSAAQAKAAHKKTYSGPRKASILSAILPGLGQAYNSLGQPLRHQKYWKIPIIYGGLGGLGYFFVVNNNEYNYFRKNLIAENDDDPSTTNTTRWSTSELQTQKTTYRKRRDLAAVGVILVYILNIIDANVDAHLKTFDVSDDLSMRVEPWQNVYNTGTGFKAAAGISIKLNFK